MEQRKKTSVRYSPEVRERAVRMVLEHGKDHVSQWEADWFNNRLLLEPIGNVPPAEAEARYYEQLTELAMVA